MSEKKEKQSNHNKLALARIVALILTFALTFLVMGALEQYYSKKYRDNKNQQTNTVQKTTQKDELGKINQFELIISKIGVDAPVIPNVDGKDASFYNKILKTGVAHYNGTALPASGSNVLIFGHSSSIFGKGTYDKIFSRLNELKLEDLIVVRFNGKEYRYLVSEKKNTRANDLSIISPTEREQLTLMTCWPIGTDRERLVIVAKPQD